MGLIEAVQFFPSPRLSVRCTRCCQRFWSIKHHKYVLRVGRKSRELKYFSAVCNKSGSPCALPWNLRISKSCLAGLNLTLCRQASSKLILVLKCHSLKPDRDLRFQLLPWFDCQAFLIWASVGCLAEKCIDLSPESYLSSFSALNHPFGIQGKGKM